MDMCAISSLCYQVRSCASLSWTEIFISLGLYIYVCRHERSRVVREVNFVFSYFMEFDMEKIIPFIEVKYWIVGHHIHAINLKLWPQYICIEASYKGFTKILSIVASGFILSDFFFLFPLYFSIIA